MSDDAKLIVPAGKLFCFSEGEYSSYGYVGHFLALEPITEATFAACKARCLARIKNGEGEIYGAQPDLGDEDEVNRAMRGLFVAELTRMGVVMDIECQEIHLGSGGNLAL